MPPAKTPSKTPTKQPAKKPAKKSLDIQPAAQLPDAPYISPGLLSLAVPIDTIIPQEKDENARRHDEKNRAGVRALLGEYGQLIPIVVDLETRKIIKGNCTYGEAKALGWEFIAVNFKEFKPGQAKAFGLDDNRIGELGSWDYQVASAHMRELQEFEDLVRLHAWTDDDIQPLLDADWQPPAVTQSNYTVGGMEAASGSGDGGPTGGQGSSLPPEHDASRAKPILVTPAQRETIEAAIERCMLMNDDHAMTEGRCIELICADYNAGI